MSTGRKITKIGERSSGDGGKKWKLIGETKREEAGDGEGEVVGPEASMVRMAAKTAHVVGGVGRQRLKDDHMGRD